MMAMFSYLCTRQYSSVFIICQALIQARVAVAVSVIFLPRPATPRHSRTTRHALLHVTAFQVRLPAARVIIDPPARHSFSHEDPFVIIATTALTAISSLAHADVTAATSTTKTIYLDDHATAVTTT